MFHFHILGYPTGYSQPNTPIKWQRKKVAVSAGSVCPHHTGNLCPIPVSHFGAMMPTTFGKTTPPGRTSPDQAKEQTDAARRRARQSIREFELIWLLQQRLRAQCLGLTGACAACSHCTATAWELSDLDHSHAATPQRVTRALCAQLLRSVLGAACR